MYIYKISTTLFHSVVVQYTSELKNNTWLNTSDQPSKHLIIQFNTLTPLPFQSNRILQPVVHPHTWLQVQK